ncbi:TPA: hypothetical protein U3O24_001362 [Streptococcus agalactiae]|uniref:competence regulator inhibitor paratox n=1 Tax=Streptococcus agalactiae TaxID=1311 RepID=UPI0002B9DB41|nr:hypothetical protein [Streptococcus agalactiae]APS24703.1 hypothetical protein AV644_03435 [Streptococcus agalactiae]ASA91908.1 hypothetical protein BB159_03680 [Streptococcus agalactiae]AWZ35109.1 hypothetical protein CDH81_10610 [Streptococcus agalactiae]EPU64269.1 hypothetical protein SAG0307_03560 [Streptococcus agalactiae GB00083]KAA8982731.1 hypothetical protein F3158_07320 [Streptococcus agalactiae]
MLDLNDFMKEVKSGRISKDSIRVVRLNGVIIDYVLPQESVSENEVVEVMTLNDMVAEIFELC